MMHSAADSTDPDEIARFDAQAAAWWDPAGPFAPLHGFNPTRLAFLRTAADGQFGTDPKALRPLAGKRVLDIGCGGGILAEPLARLGGAVTAIDPAPGSVQIARNHAEAGGLSIDYRATTAEQVLAEGKRFDIVVASEVVEHVTDLPAFVGTVSRLVTPGGLAVFTTINRTLRAFGLVILGAEYLARIIPRGTHRFERLVRPAELAAACHAAGLSIRAERGFVYNPLTKGWSTGSDMAVNYGMAAAKPQG